jgi:hypothetical protein
VSHRGDASSLSLPHLICKGGTIEPAQSLLSTVTNTTTAVLRPPPRSKVSHVENGAVNGRKPRTISTLAHTFLIMVFALSSVLTNAYPCTAIHDVLATRFGHATDSLGALNDRWH